MELRSLWLPSSAARLLGEGLGLRAQSSSGTPLARLRGQTGGKLARPSEAQRRLGLRGSGWPWAPPMGTHTAEGSAHGQLMLLGMSRPGRDQDNSANLPPSLESPESMDKTLAQCQRDWEHFLSQGLGGGGCSHLKPLGLAERRAWKIQLIPDLAPAPGLQSLLLH